MSNIIDVTYFEKGSLYIPNNKDVLVSPIDTPTNQTDLDFYITEYERYFLLNALGITLYDELQIALTDLGASAQKWQELVNGKTYTNPSGVSKRWDGLKGFNKQSVIAFFVYTEYLRNYNETFATVGVVRNDSKNATNYDATPKFIKAYRSFLEQYQSDNGATTQISVNGFGSQGIDWYGSEKTTVSLYQFLIDSNELDSTAFPDFEFKFYAQQNSYGI